MNFVLELKFRSVTIGKPTYINKWDALRFSNEGSQFIDNEQVSYRQIGFSALTPKIRFQPFKNLPTLTFQHSISIPLSFKNDGGFLDWGSPSLYNDLFFDKEVGSKSSFFFQLGVYLENIGSSLVRAANGYYQFSTPMTFIYQHFPSRKTTLYALLNAAPQWGYSVTDDGDQLTIIPDSYSQFGGGIKYFVIDSLQIELLYTKFFTSRIGSQSSTYNFGVRYFGW